ncbi:hypothetical protein [Coleofasciculus sp. G2-EDA-02]|uniref:hypothetical protein n=1 Tax=Coleofasciculus sp. G2-EDA-02 TaxID=3069529 RepID=UPI0032F823CE
MQLIRDRAGGIIKPKPLSELHCPLRVIDSRSRRMNHEAKTLVRTSLSATAVVS